MEIRDKLYIGGEWVAPSSDTTFELISPSSEEAIGRVPLAVQADVDRAVAAARSAMEGPWPQTSPADRADKIQAVANELMAKIGDFGALIANENGCPTTASGPVQVLSAHMAMVGFANATRTYPFSSDRVGGLGNPITVNRQPVGVVAGIVPWNFPLFITMLKLGPALAAGCSIVIKPTPETALDAYLLADVLDGVGLPPGVVSILPADREVSEYLVRHDGVDKVGFTGSTAVGRKIGAICGEQLKRCTLELGGKSAAIVLDDFDIDTLLPQLVDAGLLNNGQACGAQTRVLVSNNRYDEVVEALAAHVGGLKVGDATDPATQIGPMVSAVQRDRVLGYIEAGKDAGAKAVTGGGRPADLDKGFFVEPTVFAEVDNSMKIAQEEIFGPVLSVIRYEDEAQAVQIANDSVYGLCGSVWTSDLDHGAALASKVRTGCVALNSSLILDFNSPFGGFKSSGVGRELGPEGIDAYTEAQTVIRPLVF